MHSNWTVVLPNLPNCFASWVSPWLLGTSSGKTFTNHRTVPFEFYYSVRLSGSKPFMSIPGRPLHPKIVVGSLERVPMGKDISIRAFSLLLGLKRMRYLGHCPAGQV